MAKAPDASRKTNRIKRTKEDIVINIVVYTLLVLVGIATFYPMYYVFVASFSSSSAIAASPGRLLWIKDFTAGAYKLTLNHPLLFNGYKNTLIIMAIGLPINIVMTIIAGYFMASTNMMFKKLLTWMMLFTMYFSGGLVPGYLNIDQIGLMNTVWAIILPGALSVYNAIICKTAIEAIPQSLFEAAYIDGASEIKILTQITVPLIVPTLAVLTLYYGVGNWNAWLNASIYIKENIKLPLQNILRSILLANDQTLNVAAATSDSYDEFAEAIKYSSIVISTVPILCVYPFIQRYFVKGVMIGAVKG